MLDIAIQSCNTLMALPKLYELTKKPFYEEFCILLMTSIFSYQIPEQYPFRSFYIGLLPNEDVDRHLDVRGESKHTYIVEFISFIFDTLTNNSLCEKVFGKTIPKNW